MLSSLTSRRVFARVRVAAAVALACTALTAASCGDDDEDFTVAGNYELTGVATSAAPGIFVNPTGQTFTCGTGQTCEFQSGSLTLNTNNTFSLSVQGLQRATGAATGTGTQVSFVTSAAQTGTWAQSGNSITFTPSAAAVGAFTGTLSDDNAEMRVNVALQGGNNYVLRFEQ
jgi:hypothetical protein